MALITIGTQAESDHLGLLGTLVKWGKYVGKCVQIKKRKKKERMGKIRKERGRKDEQGKKG